MKMGRWWPPWEHPLHATKKSWKERWNSSLGYRLRQPSIPKRAVHKGTYWFWPDWYPSIYNVGVLPMLKMKSNIFLAAIIILSSGFLLDNAVGREDAVIFRNLQWNCTDLDDERNCDVSFALINKTSKQQVRKVDIRGIRGLPGTKDSSPRTCGRISFSILLKPREVIEILEIMPVSAIPEKITVSIWE